ncbi:MAG: cupin domain-containing protein [Rubrobacteraceae bacterium]
MARAGKEIASPTTRLVFEETAADTGGERLRFEQFVRGGNPEVSEHTHSLHEERFLVRSGRMGVRVAGSERVLGPGEEVTVPPGTPHTFWNAGDEELHHVVEFRPAGNMEVFFETVFGLQREGKFPVEGEKRAPNLFQGALILTEYDFSVAGMPIPVQKMIFRPLAFVGRLLGYRARYPRFSDAG